LSAAPLTAKTVASWPDYIGIMDASSHGVGGVVIGKLSELPPTPFCLQCPPEKTNALVMFQNPQGKINNSDLEMAGLLLLWLCIKGIAQTLELKHIVLLSNNTATVTVGWVERMTSRKSHIAAQLVTALALLGGPAQKMLFFHMVPRSFLSVLIHSTMCKYDSIEFFFKFFDWNLPIGRVKVKIVGFWLEYF
jgi:hypothetical protein